MKFLLSRKTLNPRYLSSFVLIENCDRKLNVLLIVCYITAVPLIPLTSG